MLWEICIMVTATLANASASNSLMIYLLLTFMLGTTALVDIFVWAPFFALWAGIDNEDCSGGWFTGRPYVCRPNHMKGYGRLLVRKQFTRWDSLMVDFRWPPCFVLMIFCVIYVCFASTPAPGNDAITSWRAFLLELGNFGMG